MRYLLFTSFLAACGVNGGPVEPRLIGTAQSEGTGFGNGGGGDADTDADSDADTDADTDADSDADTDPNNPNNTDDDGDGWCEGPTCTDGSQPGDCDDGYEPKHPGADITPWCLANDDLNCNGTWDAEEAACDGGNPPDPSTTDDDHDGYCEANCSDGTLPGDCADTVFAQNPGRTEIPANGIDDDCVGGDAPQQQVCTIDVDNDGAFSAGDPCGTGTDCDDDDDGHNSNVAACGGDDCDDGYAPKHPGADISGCYEDDLNCNNVDDIDEEVCNDEDGDGVTIAEGDFNDDPSDLCAEFSYPGAVELWDVCDNDGDGEQDEDGRVVLNEYEEDHANLECDIDGQNGDEDYDVLEHEHATSAPGGFTATGHGMELYPTNVCTDGTYAADSCDDVGDGVVEVHGGAYAFIAIWQCKKTDAFGLRLTLLLPQNTVEFEDYDDDPDADCRHKGYGLDTDEDAATCHDLNEDCQDVWRLSSAPFDCAQVENYNPGDVRFSYDENLDNDYESCFDDPVFAALAAW